MKQTQNSKKAWTVCMVGWFAGVALACVQNKVSPTIPILMNYFHIDMGLAGWLSSIFAVMCIIIALPAASILKNYGPKKTGVLALCVSIIGGLIGVYADHVSVLMVSRIIEGFGVGVIVVVGPALISMWFPAEKRGFPMGIWTTFMILAQSTIFLIAAPITQRFGWQGMWWFSIIICTIAAIFFALKVESPPTETNYANVEGKNVSIKEGLKSRSSWMIGLTGMFYACTSFGFVAWIAPYWSGVTKWSLSETDNWISLLYSTELVYAVIAGYILNKVLNRKILGVYSFICYAVLAFICFIITSKPLVILLVFIFPIFDTFNACLCWTLAPQTAKTPELTSVAISILNIGLNTGTLLAAPLIGWVIQSYGTTAGGIALAISALLALACLIPAKFYVTSSSNGKEPSHQ